MTVTVDYVQDLNGTKIVFRASGNILIAASVSQPGSGVILDQPMYRMLDLQRAVLKRANLGFLLSHFRLPNRT